MIKVYLDEDAIMPTKAHSSDAGWDLYATEDVVVPAISITHEFEDGIECRNNIDVGTAKIDTGVHIELPINSCGLLVSKSGLNTKHGILSTGLIDQGYTGSIVVKLYNSTSKPYFIKKGEKVSQLVLLPIITDTLELTCDKLETTERGENGFGSSGK